MNLIVSDNLATNSMLPQLFQQLHQPLLRPPSAYEPEPTSSSPPGDISPREELDLFIEWCEQQRNWRGCNSDLSAIKTTLILYGYFVDGVKRLSDGVWEKMDLKAGSLDRLKRSLIK